MTREEAKKKSQINREKDIWNGLSEDVRLAISDKVSLGEFELVIDLHHKTDKILLEQIGYTVIWNQEHNDFTIKWN